MSNMENSFDDVSCLSPQNLGSSSPSKKQSKENTITINCVTFPHPDTMPEQQLLKPTEWSYCDYFWADKKDPQGNGTVAGFELLLQKQLKGKQMQKEMSEFIRERIKIEEVRPPHCRPSQAARQPLCLGGEGPESPHRAAERPGDEDPAAGDQAEQQDRGGHQEGAEKVHTGWRRPHALCGSLQPGPVQMV
uniref:cDNA FLJ52479, highly similar to Homo sapiens growth arrest-specific 7 (GAS7), transcript variant a, mRNA n=1 Tax=Homo sapiens TaxID=9606 RepID=B7Z1S0_HUMAN|nr:unnamed protein product [Homo sapiens]